MNIDDPRIAQVAAYHMIDVEAVRGFLIDMVAIGAAPDGEAALHTVYVVLDGAAAFGRMLTEHATSDDMPTRLTWDRGTDRLVENVLTEAWTATRDLPAPDGYKGQHR